MAFYIQAPSEKVIQYLDVNVIFKNLQVCQKKKPYAELNQQFFNYWEMSNEALKNDDNFFKTETLKNIHRLKVIKILPNSYIDNMNLKIGDVIWGIEVKPLLPSKTTLFNYQNQSLEQRIEINIFVDRACRLDWMIFKNIDFDEESITHFCFTLPFDLSKSKKNFNFLWNTNDSLEKNNYFLRERSLLEGALFAKKFIIFASKEWTESLCSFLKSFLLFLIHFFKREGKLGFMVRNAPNVYLALSKNYQGSTLKTKPWEMFLIEFGKLATLQALVSILPFRGSDGFMFLKIIYTDLLTDLKKKK